MSRIPTPRNALFIDGDWLAHAAPAHHSRPDLLLSAIANRLGDLSHAVSFFSQTFMDRGSAEDWAAVVRALNDAGAMVNVVSDLDAELGLSIVEHVLTTTVETVILVSGNGDLLPALRRANMHGAHTTVVATAKATARQLLMGSGYIPLSELVADPIARPDRQDLSEDRDDALLGTTRLDARVSAVSDALIRQLAENPRLMYELHPRAFEELMAELYARQGFEVELTQQTRDGGVDLYLVSRGPFGRALTLVDVKRQRPNRPVGVGVIRQLYGVVEAMKATAGIVATTSFFTPDAQRFREDVRFRLGLSDYVNLQTMLRNADGRR